MKIFFANIELVAPQVNIVDVMDAINNDRAFADTFVIMVFFHLE